MAESDDRNDAATVAADPNPTPAPVVELASDVRRRRARREQLPQDDVPHTAGARTRPERLDRARELAVTCARVADDNRGKDVLLLDLREATPLVDFFVIATATSRRQTHAIAEDVDKEMKRRGEVKLAVEGSEEGRWILIDYGDFVVHVLSDEARAFYALEEIWGDAERLDWHDPERPRPVAPQPD